MKNYILLNRSKPFEDFNTKYFDNCEEQSNEIFNISREDNNLCHGSYFGLNCKVNSYSLLHFCNKNSAAIPSDYINSETLKLIIDKLVNTYAYLGTSKSNILAIHFGNKEGKELWDHTYKLDENLKSYKKFRVTYYTSTEHDKYDFNELFKVFDKQIMMDYAFQNTKKELIELFIPLAIDFQGLELAEHEKKNKYLKEIISSYDFDKILKRFEELIVLLKGIKDPKREYLKKFLNEHTEFKMKIQSDEFIGKYMKKNRNVFSFADWFKAFVQELDEYEIKNNS